MLHKFNTFIRLGIVFFLIVPTPSLAYHVTTQAPYNQSIAIDTTTGDITIGIYTSDGLEDSTPEKYTIFFDIDNDVTTDSFCVSTSFGHTGNLEWNYHTFSLSDLQTYFENPYGNFRVKIRADNDTDNSFSDLTQQMNIDIPNELPFVNLVWNGLPQTTCNDTSTTTTTTTIAEDTTTTSSTTTTLPPKKEEETPPPPPPPPAPEPDPEPYVDPYIVEDIEVVLDDGSVGTYSQSDIDDGTVERDNERKANEDLYGCALTDAQIARGDCDIVETVIIEEDEEVFVEEGGEEFSDDVVVLDDMEDQYDDEEIIELTEEEVERETKKSELKEEIEIFIFEDEEEIEEFVDTVLEVEEFLEEFEEVEIIIVEDLDELEIDIDDFDTEFEEIEEDELDEILPGDDTKRTEEVQEEDEILEENEEVVLTEEEVAVEVAEVEEVIEDIIVEEVTTEEAIEVIEQVNDIGVQNLDQATEEVQEVVQAVVEEAIDNVEELTEEQVEVVQEVLQLDEPEDVEIIAEAVKEDEAVAEAVEEYVERAVENADVEDYNLADVVTEVQTEEFLADPIGAFTDIDVAAIDLTTIGDTMTSTQKEKAQEVVVPVIIASQIVASVQVVPVRIRRRV